MRSEDLLQLAAVHGVDLTAAARIAAKPVRIPTRVKTVNGVPTTILVEPKPNGVKGKQTPTSIKPKWTLAEVAQACAGVPEICYLTATYIYAGSDQHYWKLHRALRDRAMIMASESGREWPLEVTDYHMIKRPYIDHLAKLVLDECRSPHLFTLAPALYAAYMGVSEKTWDTVLALRYHDLRAVFEEWREETVRRVQHKLSARE